jgi:hypothetical protein
VLAKVATYKTKKGVSDAAQKASDTASARANAARVAFDAMVADGEDDQNKLTSLLNAVVDTALDAAAKQEDLSAKSTLASQANTQLGDAVYALIIPPA